jgi:uncharacterized protein YcfJ
MSLRVMLAVLGAVFGIVWATSGIGWAAVVALCALAGWYIGALIEGEATLSVLLDPLRRTR